MKIFNIGGNVYIRIIIEMAAAAGGGGGPSLSAFVASAKNPLDAELDNLSSKVQDMMNGIQTITATLNDIDDPEQIKMVNSIIQKLNQSLINLNDQITLIKTKINGNAFLDDTSSQVGSSPSSVQSIGSVGSVGGSRRKNSTHRRRKSRTASAARRRRRRTARK